MKRWNAVLSRLLLALAGMLVVLLPAELWFRPRVRLHPPISRQDPVTLFSLRPNRSVRDTSPGEFSVAYTTNRLGLRYREMTVEKPAGTRRILGVGDSFTFGVGVEQEQTFLAQLESLLGRSRQAPVEVVNCGTSGWGTSHALAFVESKAFDFSPDLILLGFFANDPKDDSRSGLFRVVEGELTRTPPDQLDVFFPEQAILHHLPFYDFLASRSALLAVLRTRYINWRYASKNRTTREPAPDSGSRFELEEDGLVLTRLLFRRLRQVTAQHRVPLVVLLIPGWGAIAQGQQGGEVRSQLPAVGEICLSEGILCLDSIPILLGSGYSVDELYFTVRDIHWKPLAHRLIGEALYEFLLANNLPLIAGGTSAIRSEP